MNPTCPDCWELLSLEEPGELLWDYLDLGTRRSLAFMHSIGVRVFACYGCGYWRPAGKRQPALAG